MQKLIELLSEDYRYRLSNVTYQPFDSADGSNSSDLCVNDNCYVLSAAKNKLVIHIERTVKFEPKGVFELSVSFDVEKQVKKEYLDSIDLTAYNLQEQIEEDPLLYFGEVMERISILISQIMLAAGFTPIITPPTWIQ